MERKKNKLLKKKYLLLIIISTVLISCTDQFLTEQPTSAISEDKIFKSRVMAEAALVGAYDQLSSFDLEGLYVPLMSDIIGEDVMINSVDNWNWFVQVYQLKVLPNYSYVESPWKASYKLIYDANKLIESAQQIPDATATQRSRIEGEARVLRAYIMLKIVQMYAPPYSENSSLPSILLVTTPLQHNDPDLPRAELKDVYAQIESDLLAATSLLIDNNDKSFFDRRSAKALLARTYLDMGEWAKARDMAKGAYEGLSLMGISDLLGGFFSRNSETIFTIGYTASDNNVYLSIPSFYWPVAGYSSIRAHDKFVEKFSRQDARRDYFLKQSDIDPNRYLILKFAHNNSVGNAERICIRASEMYLIEAECEAELGNSLTAQNALYQIQKRSNPGIQKNTSTGEALLNEILMERRRELFGEGFRWNDIKRRRLSFTREVDHWVTLNINSTDPDYYRLTFPIPQSEIDANTVLTEADQNSGY